jgi:hypothetical protein
MEKKALSVALVSLLCVMASAPPASAGSGAIAVNSLGASTTVWSVSPAPRNGTPANEAFAVTWTVVSNTAYSYFDAVNTGAGPLSSITLTAVGAPSTDKAGSAVVTLELCAGGTWNPVGNTCSSNTVVGLGSIQGSIAGPSTLNTVVPYSLAVGERLALRATTPQNRRADLTTTVSFSVSRSSARPPTTTNS